MALVRHLLLTSGMTQIRLRNVNIIRCQNYSEANPNPTYYVQATRALAARLGCENIDFPGHHDLSFWMPREFANAIQNTLERYK
jgi:hypothetical protein